MPVAGPAWYPWGDPHGYAFGPHPFVCDGSVMPTQGSANPGLTIQALATRTADYLISQGGSIFSSDRRDPTPGRFRPELSPPGTHGPGVPRLR